MTPRSPAKPINEDGPWASAFAPRAKGERRYWLVKSDPDSFSFDDLLAAARKTTTWDGVRNFAARNFLRDGMKLGDGVLFYQSMTSDKVIVGTCEVVREGYPDPTAFDRNDSHFDPKSERADPTWYMVDLRAVTKFPRPVPLAAVKARRELANMALVRIGRLSVSPVTKQEWDTINEMGGV